MPQLERKPFTPEKPPKDLKPDEEVFVCQHTNEVYRDYELFFKRTILCNSLVWSCRFSGKSGLTYQEAEESEQDIIKYAKSLPVPIQRAALTLVHHTQRGRLANLCDEVFSYLKDRFQEGENVEVQHGGKRLRGVIESVIEPDELPNGVGDPFDTPSKKTSSESLSSPKEKKSTVTPGKIRKHSSGDKNTPTKSRKDSKSPAKAARTSSESDKKSRKGSAGEKTPKKSSKSSSSAEADVIVIEDEDESTKKDKAVGTPGIPKKKSSTSSWPSAKGYKYAVKIFPEKVLKKKDGKKPKAEIVIVDGSCVSRYKGALTRDKLKNFLKLSCVRSTASSEDGFYFVEVKYRMKFDLGDVPFPIPLPSDSSPTKKKSRKRSKSNTGEGEESSPTKRKKKKGEDDAGKKSKDGKKSKKSPEKKLTQEEKLKIIEEDKEKRRKQIEEDKEKRRVQREQDRAELRVKKEEERVQRKLERDQERERVKEQKRQEALWYREWSKPREDLQLDDLKELPMPVPVKIHFPSQLFGDAVMVLEFLNVFGSLFDMKDEFPSGLTFAMLEDALTEHDAEGVYYDMLQFLLGAILRTHMDEEEDEGLESSHTADTKTALQVDEEDEHRAVVSASAAMAAVWPILHQGKPLHELIMDPFTCTELLRLHLLSSGARIGCGASEYRWHSRGGFTYADDAGVEFRHRETGIITALMTGTVYDLGVEDKLKILMALCGQLLTYATSRDYVEEGFERIKKARREWLSDQWKEQRREKEEAAAKYKRKIEEKARQREEMEKRKKEGDGSKDASLPKSQVDVKPPEQPAEEEPSKESKKSRKSKKKQTKEPEKDQGEPEEDKSKEEAAEKEKAKEVEEPMLSKEEEEERALEKRKERERRDQDYLNEIHKATCISSIQPLGRDRMYRRYWIFKCLKGLFIEDDDPELPHYLETIVEEKESDDEEESEDEDEDEAEKSIEKMDTDQNENTTPPTIDLTDDKDDEPGNSENKKDEMTDRTVSREIKKMIKDTNITSEIPKHKELGKEEILSNVRNVSERAVTQWSFIACPEDLENLVNSLNPRGVRERCLREALQHDYKRLKTGVEKCPFRETNVVHKKEVKLYRGGRPRTRGQQGVNKARYTNMEDFSEANLRDQILDLEDRIWQGGLGMTKVEDRYAWRVKIENGIYDDPDWIAEDRKLAEVKKEGVKSEEDAKKGKEEVGETERKQDSPELPNGIENGVQKKEDGESGVEVGVNGFTNNAESTDKGEATTELKKEVVKPEEPAENVEEKPLTNGDVTMKDEDESCKELAKIEEKTSMEFSAIPSRLTLDLSRDHQTSSQPESRAGTPIFSLASPSFLVNPAVKELALALLKVEQGIELKYLSPPLGEDEETKRQKQKEAAAAALKEYEAMMKAVEEKGKEKKKRKKEGDKTEEQSNGKNEDNKDENEDGKDDDSSSSSSSEGPAQKQKTVLERWEESLLSSTSLSQVFVHLNTLDGSITWAKSVLNARCRLCRRKGDAEKMLLCDACDRGHHMYCLKPPIKQIPEGNWFCTDCRPKEPRSSDRRRKAAIKAEEEEEEEEESSDDESESGEESNSDTEEYEHTDEESKKGPSESESEHGDSCAVCTEGGELLCCDICPLAYHVHCAYPALRRVPRGNWACQVCTGADEDRSSKARVKKATIKAALKKAKEKQKPVKSSKKLNTSKQETKKKPQKRKRSPSPAPRGRAGNTDSAPKAKRQKVTESAKSSRSSSPALKGIKRTPASVRIRGRSSMDSSRSVSPARKAPTRRDPRLTGRLLKCDKLLKEVMDHEDADNFVETPGGRNIKKSDYRTLIKDPIDLTMIKKKLDEHEYESVDDFLSDVRKVFIDCAEYFRPRAKEAKAGVRLSAMFETRFSEMGLDTSEVRAVRGCRRT